MMYKKIRSQLVFMFLALIFSINSATGQAIRAVWLYHFKTWMNTPGEIEKRIATVSALKFGDIYLGVDSDQLNVSGNYQTKILYFLSQAQTLGITVHAITLQEEHFNLSSYHTNALNRIQAILDFNAAHSGSAFASIQIDTEPHILTEARHAGHSHDFWTTNAEAAMGGLPAIETSNPTLAAQIKTRRAGIMNEFVSLLQQIRTKVNNHNASYNPDVEFSSTVGWWYNEKSNGQPNGYLPTAAGDLAIHLDALAPMVYSGGIGQSVSDIIPRVDDEIVVANASTLIGVSVDDLGDYAAVANAIESLTNHYAGDSDYKGVAVFKYQTLAASAASISCASTTDNLEDLVECIRGAMPAKDSEGFVLPNPGVHSFLPPSLQVDWKNLIKTMLSKASGGGSFSTISLPTSLSGIYNLVEFQDQCDAETYWVLLETLDADNNGKVDYGWGTFILNPNALRELCIQVPHPLNEANTPTQGISIFKGIDARSFLMAGTHRRANAAASICQSNYRESDVAHNDNTLFHRATEALKDGYGSSNFTVLQLHGMAAPTASSCSGSNNCNGINIYMTNGKNAVPTTGLGLANLKNEMVASNLNWTIKVPGDPGIQCCLNGTSNVQGRLLNLSSNVCSTNAPSATERFIHIEQEPGSDTYRNAVYWIPAICSAFPVSGTNTAVVEKCDGLLDSEATIPGSQNVKYQSCEAVILKEGFVAKAGTVFQAVHVNCSN